MTEPSIRAVRIEARRIARELIRTEIRQRGMKPSYFKASEVNSFAEELIAKDPSITRKAIDNLKTTRTTDAVRKLVIPER